MRMHASRARRSVSSSSGVGSGSGGGVTTTGSGSGSTGASSGKSRVVEQPANTMASVAIATNRMRVALFPNTNHHGVNAGAVQSAAQLIEPVQVIDRPDTDPMVNLIVDRDLLKSGLDIQ